ncbi:MAG: hypothetical protein AAF685_07030, partial [Cyanobacteria bacterium P01_C01_bin.89]
MLVIAFHLSQKGHHLIGLGLTVYLLGFTACYLQVLGKKLDERSPSMASTDANRANFSTADPVSSGSSGKNCEEGQQSAPWKDAAVIVFPPIWSELLWFRRLWRR